MDQVLVPPISGTEKKKRRRNAPETHDFIEEVVEEVIEMVREKKIGSILHLYLVCGIEISCSSHVLF